MRGTVIPHLKPILNTSKLYIEMQIAMKWYIFLSVQQLRQIEKRDTSQMSVLILDLALAALLRPAMLLS